jgi:prepilin signal peptidase PulO-like enzyme (type II secretory pathway)
MGDVTSSIMAGHAVGVYGVTAFMGWWALMGMLGLVWMAVLVRLGRSGEGRGPREVPFVPPIMVAALCSVFLG